MPITKKDIALADSDNLSLTQKLARYLLGELTGYDDTGNPLDAAQYYDPTNITKRLNQDVANKVLSSEDAVAMGKSLMKESQVAAPFMDGTPLKNVKLQNWAKLAGTAAMKHPFKTAGLVGLGAGNIGGLTDNDKFGGQLAGLGLGGLGAHMLASGNPYAAAMITMGGGALGSLFDKLRAQKEQEQAQIKQFAQGRR